MTVNVALFRGINVGGKHSLPMQDLRDILTSLGCEDVKTYIQSGNAVFHTTSAAGSLADEIKAVIGERFGFSPWVLLLTVAEFVEIAAANPYADAESMPKSLHVLFLAESPKSPDLNSLNVVKAESESFELGDRAFYLHAPDGIGRSKLAAKVEKALGVEATGRNWRTVSKLLELADTIVS